MSDDVVDFAAGAGSPAPVAGQSILERMRAEYAARKVAAAKTVTLRHDQVPGLTLTCRLVVDGEEMSDVSQRAAKRAGTSGASAVWFNRLLIARCCTRIEFHGEVLEDDKGTVLTFASPEVQAVFEAADAALAVRAALGSDAYVAALANTLTEESGFGRTEAVEVVADPTTGH